MGDAEVDNSTVNTWPVGASVVTLDPISTIHVAFDGIGVFTIQTTGVYRFAVSMVTRSSVDINVILNVNVNGVSRVSQVMSQLILATRMLPLSLSLVANDQVTFEAYTPNQYRPVVSAGGSQPYPTVYRLSVVYFYKVI